jgi:hypothetical protein
MLTDFYMMAQNPDDDSTVGVKLDTRPKTKRR